MMTFEDRFDAGRKLAGRLAHLRGEDLLVLALPRGGVEVSYEVARALGAPLGIVITRKVGHPLNPEVAVCAVTEEGEMVCGPLAERVDPGWLERAAREQMAEARRRRETYAPHAADVAPEGRTVILVDDGVATGLTMLAAVRALRRHRPRKLVVAVPVAPPEMIDELRRLADEVVVLTGQEGFVGAVGAYYRRFAQTSDEEVIRLLEAARAAWEAGGGGKAPGPEGGDAPEGG